MTYRKWYRLITLLALIGLLLRLVGIVLAPKAAPLKIIGIVIFVLSILLIFIKLRCPYCHKMIPDVRNLHYCPHCGKELDLGK